MKQLLTITFTFLSFLSFGQDKYNYVHFNKITEVTGTEYVIASIDDMGKMLETKSKYLLFINTLTDETIQVDFPKDASIGKLEQVKIDSLEINLIIVEARTIDLNGKNGIDWNDPTQIIILHPYGKQKTQLTEDNFFVRSWAVNKLTGTIVITGHYDTNNNNKYDKSDKNEIHIYDLKTLQLKRKI